MKSVFTSEFVETDKQLFVVLGDITPLTQEFIAAIQTSFKCIVLNNTTRFTQSSSLIQVSSHASSTISELRDRIEYAVVFLQNNDDKSVFARIQEKLERDKTKTLIIIPLALRDQFYDVILTSKMNRSFQYVLLGDLYGERVSSSHSTFSETIHNVVTKNTITFTGDDLTPLFPIAIQDAITGIQSLLFTTHQKRLWLLYYEHPQSIISAAHIFKKTFPELRVEYARESRESISYSSHKSIALEIERKTHLAPEYLGGLEGFEKSLKKLVPNAYASSKITSKKKARTRPIRKYKSFKNNILVNASIIALLLFVAINVFTTAIGAYFARQMVNSLDNGHYSEALQHMRTSHTFLSISYPLLSTGASLFSLVPIFPLQESINTFQIGTKLSSSILEEIATVSITSPFATQTHLQSTMATLFHIYFSIQPSSLSERFHQLSWFYTPEYTQLLTFAGILPDVLGYKQEKNYLLLFQNNGEIRPTGGFIGSIGELQVKNGEIMDLTIRDVYELDGQLKNHKEPPFIVRRYLQPHLYLRDSNFALDFQESATIAAQLYFEQTGKKVDGVVGVDFEVLKQVIEKTGPLYLPSQNKTLDSKSSFEFIQQTIEEDFFPGSTGKRDILNEVFIQIMEAMKDPDKSLAILQILPGLLNDKHILVALKDPTLQEVFSAQRFAGELKDTRITKNDVISDFFAFNEANIGVNKVNREVTRTALYNTSISETRMESTATILITNQSTTEPYTSYLRVIAPIDSTLLSISIDGQRQPLVAAITDPQRYESNTFSAPSELEVTEEVYQQKRIFGFIIKVEEEKTQRVSVQYERRISDLPANFTYSLLTVSQPGTYQYPFTLRIAYPQSIEPKKTTDALLENRAIIFQESISRDTTFTADFIKSSLNQEEQ